MAGMARRVGAGWLALACVASILVAGCTAVVSARSIDLTTARALDALGGEVDRAARDAFAATAAAAMSSGQSGAFECGVMDASAAGAGDEASD
jgi:hypothetical protein